MSNEDLLDSSMQNLDLQKIVDYNLHVVSSVLRYGIRGGADMRNEDGVITSVSGVMRNEISCVVLPTESDIKEAYDGLVKVANIATGYLPKDDPTITGVLKDIVLKGNAAGLLPVATERPWERFDQERYYHTIEVWEDRLAANFIVAISLNSVKPDPNLMQLNYFEGRFLAPFEPEDFAHIFVPNQLLPLFEGADPRIVTSVAKEKQMLEMYFCDSPDESKKRDTRIFNVPDYVNAIYKFITNSPGRYVLHLVRLACASDLVYIKDVQRNSDPLTSDELARLGRRSGS